MIEQFNTTEKVDAALAELKQSWSDLLSKYTVNTPDDKMNRMVNIWNQYQCMVTFNMSRSASYFESGIGRGIGFRDSNQDLLGFVHQIPDRARERILDLAATQFEDGGCFHQYQPLTKKGNDAVGGDFSDDPLWMILSTAAYIKETGDYSILDEMVPYRNDEKLAQTMMHHLQQSFYRVVNNVGPHGLPLCKHQGLNDKAEAAQAEIDKMKNLICEYGYDGEWFLRAYDDFGRKVGSKECEEGKIFIEPQGFAVMSEIGKDKGYDLKTLESIDKYLNCKHGLVLNNPAFTKYYIEYGEISTYPAGYKENAGIFCHNNAWIICAEAYVGHGDKAFEYYSKIAPAYLEDISDLHRTEPYVYAQMIAGKDAGRFGEAKNSWLTGTAAWNFVAVSQYMLGIIPDYDGLKIDPSIPSEWDGFKATRQFRNATYQISVSNPSHVSKGVKSVTVDGNAIEGNILPVFADGKEHTVEVVLG